MSLEGQRVSHPKYGSGIVINRMGGAFLLLVKFDKGITLYVRRDECRFPDLKRQTEKPSIKIPIIIEAVIPELPKEIPAACFIDTLRLGIVPNDVSSFTFGRDLELGKVADWIAKPNAPPLLIVGNYGSGKTHFLECLRDTYLKAGWAVSYLQIDPNECPLHKPKRVYNRIIKSIRFLEKGRELGFRDFIINRSVKNQGSVGHEYLDCVLHACRQYNALAEYILDWIEGSGPTSYYAGLPLYDDAPSTNIYCSILSSLADLTKKSGLKGLIIMLDESEQIGGTWYVPYQQPKALDFFLGLSLTASASSSLIEKPVWNNNPPPTFIGSKSGLPYSARKPVSYTRSNISSLKMIFAFTDIDFLRGIFYQRMGSPQVILLRPLENKTKAEILHSLYDVYLTAYPGCAYEKVDELIRDILFAKKYSENVRTMIKAFIEALDIIRYYAIKSHESFVH